MAAYVVTSWQVEPNAPAGADLVLIKGRAPGLFAWLLSLVGIEPTISLRVTCDTMYYEQGSLAGSIRRLIPLSRISSAYFGYSKPWKEALAIAVFIGLPTFGLGFIIAVIYYLLNKSMSIGIVEVGGTDSGIQFKRSVIEGKKVDEGASAEVAALLERLMAAKTA